MKFSDKPNALVGITDAVNDSIHDTPQMSIYYIELRPANFLFTYYLDIEMDYHQSTTIG